MYRRRQGPDPECNAVDRDPAVCLFVFVFVFVFGGMLWWVVAYGTDGFGGGLDGGWWVSVDCWVCGVDWM